MGGCQQETKKGDQVLWAFDAFSKNYFLKVSPAELVVKKGGYEECYCYGWDEWGADCGGGY